MNTLPDKIYCDKSRMNEVIENCSKDKKGSRNIWNQFTF